MSSMTIHSMHLRAERILTRYFRLVVSDPNFGTDLTF